MEETLSTPFFRFVVAVSSMKWSDVNPPVLVLFVSLVDIVIYYSKVLPMHYAQTDPLRRWEIWRLVSSSFQHIEINDAIPDEHLWMNIVGQLYFGWILEANVGSGNTLLVYIAASISGALLSSAKDPCSPPGVGASCALYGLVTACLSEYVLTGNWRQNWTCLAVCVTIATEISRFVLQVFEVTTLKDYDGAAHIGGALGGFIVGVYIWNKQLPALPSQRKSYITNFTFVFSIVFIAVVGGRYCYFAYVLSPDLAIRQNLRNVLLEKNDRVFDTVSLYLCKTYWRSYTEGNQTMYNSVRNLVQLDKTSDLAHILKLVGLTKNNHTASV